MLVFCFCFLERFWVDVVLRNPLDAEVNLSNVTLVIKEDGSLASGESAVVDVEVVDIVLSARETRTVGLSYLCPLT
jgi:trafficking protein particle complex subunit 8